MLHAGVHVAARVPDVDQGVTQVRCQHTGNEQDGSLGVDGQGRDRRQIGGQGGKHLVRRRGTLVNGQGGEDLQVGAEDKTGRRTGLAQLARRGDRPLRIREHWKGRLAGGSGPAVLHGKQGQRASGPVGQRGGEGQQRRQLGRWTKQEDGPRASGAGGKQRGRA